MNRTLPFAMLAVIFTFPVFSQDYLGDDLVFFQKKARLYQHWLDAKGMGKVLKVDKVELKKNDMELELFLGLRTTDPDTAAAMWTALVSGFEEQNKDEKIGDVLFGTFARMMEIPPEQGNIQIYFPREDGFGYNPCFYVWFWEEGGQVQEEARINNCKAQKFDVVVRPPEVQTVSREEDLSIRKSGSGRVIFQKIIDYARQRYELEKCAEREPRVNYDEDELTDYSLIFTVTDLCKEVLKDEEKSVWCDIVEFWGGVCNDRRRERLEFEFTYIPMEDGYRLKVELTGKFGSGVYVPRDDAYMDMEPDFEDYLIKYVKEDFKKDLRNYLENN